MKKLSKKNDEKLIRASMIFENRISKLYQHFNQMMHKSLSYFRGIILEIKRRKILKKSKDSKVKALESYEWNREINILFIECTPQIIERFIEEYMGLPQ